MIAHLNGKLTEIYPTHLVLECHGVGYHVIISLNSYSKFGKEENLKIFTHLIVREDAQILYGFHSEQEREVFLKLISVNGVGPSSAMMMLSSLEIDEIRMAIESADVKTLQSVKGIGAKTAQRIIIDLKDKLEGDIFNFNINSDNSKNKSKFEALSALGVLGIPTKTAEKVLEIVSKDFPDAEADVLVKEVLKRI
ncbi:Holliday junction branch migration protein RuvA [Moheibacter lacus]|uniref:Holliday junction branch migration complex subunit RuvA n=1 Tax=Moheibacter lacus TaxID=2745851 RepID=A0A838ZRS9_9FLAO|nr:Holliday junction branch migration protein RuvA [Moheibacter lacus]MBA5629283.1 Holliday junction branch migration protein RuvA [Moheibacter lacus]